MRVPPTGTERLSCLLRGETQSGEIDSSGEIRNTFFPLSLPEFAGKVNLIYIDPPFNTGQDFFFTATIPSELDDSEGVSKFRQAPIGH